MREVFCQPSLLGCHARASSRGADLRRRFIGARERRVKGRDVTVNILNARGG